MPPQKYAHTNLDPEVWGPHYWFFIHCVAMSYPNFPNAVTKKKYYEFFQNLPLFIPVEDIAAKFSKILDEFPVQPYLDNREALIKWSWFVHNKVNVALEKPTISLDDFYLSFYEKFKTKQQKVSEFVKWKGKIVYIGCFALIAGSIYYLYDK